MNIVAKSACDIKQITDRINKGFHHIEIQLTNDFLMPTRSLQDYSVIHSSKDWDIQNIHMPLTKIDDVNLEYLGNSTYSSVFFNACKLAQDCALTYNHPVTLVIHCGQSLSNFKLMPSVLHDVEKILLLCMNYYPNVLFSIENLSPCYTKKGKVVLQPTAFGENVELANYFNNLFETNKFHTTIDICHILMTQNLLNFLKPESSIDADDFSLEWYFKQNQSTVNNIHLNNIRGLGIKKMHHGASFVETNEHDMKLLKEIFSLYNKYNYFCNLTLEDDELDYIDIKEAPKLKSLIEKLR